RGARKDVTVPAADRVAALVAACAQASTTDVRWAIARGQTPVPLPELRFVFAIPQPDGQTFETHGFHVGDPGDSAGYALEYSDNDHDGMLSTGDLAILHHPDGVAGQPRIDDEWAGHRANLECF